MINGGLETHELVLGPAAVQDAWAAAERPAANPPPGPTPRVSVAPEVSGIRIVAASGASQTVIYMVPDDLSVQLLLQCHIADHLERGMAAAVRFVGPGGVILTPPPGASSAAPRPLPPAGPTPVATRP